MLIPARRESHTIAGWICIPFIAISLIDGYWKIKLLHGPLISFWAYDVANWIVLPTVLLMILHRLTVVTPENYGLSADLGKRDILYVLPLPFITLFMVDFIGMGIAEILIRSDQSTFNYSPVLAPLGPLAIVGTFYLSATAGIWESLFFIGLPWLWLSKGRHTSKWVTRTFALGTALLFAACHWENGTRNVAGAFCFQILAVWWYFRLGTLWPVIGAHFLIDVIYFWPLARI